MSEEDSIPMSGSDSGSRKRQFDELVKQPTDFANKFRRVRACARCHRLKMRCVFEDPNFESCTRCFKAGVKCSATEDPTESQAKRKPRKRSKLKGDGPLAQLQQAINESNKLFQVIQRNEDDCYDTENINVENLLTLQFQLSETQRLLLHAVNSQRSKESMPAYDSGTESYCHGKSDSSKQEANSINSMKDGTVKAIPNLPWISHDLNIMKELIKLDIISTSEAKTRLDYFFTDLHVYWPCVSFPKHYTYEWLLEHEPLVLLSFITVTCLNDPELHDALLYYLEENLSIRTSITGNISVSFIQVYLVLSLWCSPPKKWGSYKHQMSLLMALNLTLCLDLGNEVYKNTSNVLNDDSTERHMIRSYMGVYACCGSLGLSLPRFKVVSWTPVHERCSQLLLLGESNAADKFLYYYSKLVALGEEIFQFLCPNGFPNTSVRKIGENGSSINTNDVLINNGVLRNTMVNYEKRMQKLAIESNLFKSSSKTRNLLSIIYYQLLMTMYDYIVCRVLLRRDVLTEVYLQTLNRLIKASEKVIESFVLLCNQTANFPTFFYYRPMHALVALIRARLLVKTQQLDFEVNVEQAYDKVFHSVNKIAQTSKVANKMSAILTRISKWMKVSSRFNKNGATNSMVDLLNELGKEKAIEKIKINVTTTSSHNGNSSKKEVVNNITNTSASENRNVNNINNININHNSENVKNGTNGTGNGSYNIDHTKISGDSGDNLNMSNDSRIQFNKFINYGIDSMATNVPPTSVPAASEPLSTNLLPPPINSIQMQKAPVAPGPIDNEVEDRSNSIFVPSPIGYSHSEIMDTSRTQQQEEQPTDPTANILPLDNSVTAADSKQTISNQAIQSYQPLTNKDSYYNSPGINSTGSTGVLNDGLNFNTQQLNQILRSKTPSLSEGGSIGSIPGLFSIPRSTSISQPEFDSVGLPSNEKHLQQQDHDFLNDIFSQIDIDIMNSEGTDPQAGLGVAPMFDFLGTTGFPSDQQIPEDWYKSL